LRFSCRRLRSEALLAFAFALLLAAVTHAAPRASTGGVGAAVSITGPQRLLVIPVRFPGVTPERSMREINGKVRQVAQWVEQASYGKASIDPTVLEWQPLPSRLETYRVSPYNYQVDRERVRRLVEDALSAAARRVRVADFKYVYIVVGAHTEPGTGYGMIAYAANPGMLTGVRRGRLQLEEVRLADGSAYSGGIIVSAENAHPGHVVHDLLHALGGARDGKRAVEELFKVKVLRVRTMNVRGKYRRFGRGGGYRPDWKKAIVTLSPGQKIDLGR